MENNQAGYRMGIFAVVVAAILWGTTGTAATFAPEVSPFAIGAVAMGVGGLLQCLIAYKYIWREKQNILKNWLYWLLGAIAVTIYPLAFYFSMAAAGVTVGTILTIGSAPFFTAFIEYFFDKERFSSKFIRALIIGVIGMGLISYGKLIAVVNDGEAVTADFDFGAFHAAVITIGIICALGAGFTYAIYSWTARRMMYSGISSRSAMGATFGLGGFMLMPILFCEGASLLHSWNNFSVGLYMAFVPMFIGYMCFGIGLSKIKASLAITITLLEPVVAVLLARLIVGETLTWFAWLGVLLVIICFVLVTLPLNRLNIFAKK